MVGSFASHIKFDYLDKLFACNLYSLWCRRFWILIRVLILEH